MQPSTSIYFLKLVNYGADTAEMIVTILKMSKGTLIIVSGPADGFNSDSEPSSIVPRRTDVKGSKWTFKVKLLAWSVATLAVK
jgi:alpha-N-arabinofuranosidase